MYGGKFVADMPGWERKVLFDLNGNCVSVSPYSEISNMVPYSSTEGIGTQYSSDYTKTEFWVFDLKTGKSWKKGQMNDIRYYVKYNGDRSGCYIE